MSKSMETSEQPTLPSSRVRRWLGHLFREWTIESWRPMASAFAKPTPATWSDAQVTLAWLGHATVLINFFGIKILTDPALFPRVGIRLPGFTIGPKRLTAPALQFHELPKIDLILLSHAHFDHLDLRTLRHFDQNTPMLIARPSRPWKWQMPQARSSSCRCIIKRFGLALSRFVSRSSASKPRWVTRPNALRSGKSGKLLSYRCSRPAHTSRQVGQTFAAAPCFSHASRSEVAAAKRLCQARADAMFARFAPT